MNTTNTNLTAKALVNKIANNEVNFNLAIQRSNVWKDSQKTSLIESILKGFPTGVIYFWKKDNGYDALDGKQRCSAIQEFLNDELQLPEDFSLINDGKEDTDLSEMMFSELPDWAKSRIEDYLFMIVVLDQSTPYDEICQFFYNINNGIALTKQEKRRALSVSFESFKRIANSPAIVAACTDKSMKRYKDEIIAEQIYSMMYQSDDKELDEYIMNAIVTKEQEEKIINALNWVNNARVIIDMPTISKEDKHLLRCMKTQTHLIAMAYLASKFIEGGQTEDLYRKALRAFFKSSDRSATVNNNYNMASSSHTAVNSSVMKRKQAMDELYTNTITSLNTADGVKESE